MRLCCRETGINVIDISAESSLRLRADDSGIQPIDESGEGWRERRGVVGDASVVLKNPQAAAVGIGGGRGGRNVDLGIRAPVKADDGEPCLFRSKMRNQDRCR